MGTEESEKNTQIPLNGGRYKIIELKKIADDTYEVTTYFEYEIKDKKLEAIELGYVIRVQARSPESGALIEVVGKNVNGEVVFSGFCPKGCNNIEQHELSILLSHLEDPNYSKNYGLLQSLEGDYLSFEDYQAAIAKNPDYYYDQNPIPGPDYGEEKLSENDDEEGDKVEGSGNYPDEEDEEADVEGSGNQGDDGVEGSRNPLGEETEGGGDRSDDFFYDTTKTPIPSQPSNRLETQIEPQQKIDKQVEIATQITTQNQGFPADWVNTPDGRAVADYRTNDSSTTGSLTGINNDGSIFIYVGVTTLLTLTALIVGLICYFKPSWFKQAASQNTPNNFELGNVPTQADDDWKSEEGWQFCSFGNKDTHQVPNTAGTNLAGTNLAGTNLAGTNLAGNCSSDVTALEHIE